MKKIGFPVSGSAAFLAIQLAVLLPLCTGPVWSAPTMSQELKSAIMTRMPESSQRDKVLLITAQAVEKGYPEKHLAPVIERALEGGISGDSLSEMIENLKLAHGKGLPTRPLTEKIMEGLAKEVGEDLILLALQRIDERMDYAASQVRKLKLDSESSIDLITKTGDAVAAGMDQKNLERIFDVMAHERINRRISPEDLMEMVKTASGYGEDPESISDKAVSLLRRKNADYKDIRKYLEKLSLKAYRKDLGSIRGSDSGEDPDSEGPEEDEEDGSNEGDDGDDGDDHDEDGGERDSDSEEEESDGEDRDDN